MDKYVVVSTNNNPDYYFYSPYIKKAWNALGWKVATIITHDVNPVMVDADIVIQLPNIEGLRLETVAQVSRLYAANVMPLDCLIMTSDMDLLPLSDYWHPNESEITVYGHDLTDYTYYPMGYIAMTCAKWKEIMRLTMNNESDILRDAKEFEHLAYAKDWEAWWNYDWTLVTERLKKHQVRFINRGRRSTGSGAGTFAFGRVDRGDSMKIPNEPLIDAHCENNNVRHPDKLNKFISLFETHYGKL